MTTTNPTVLFVCVHNAGRSQMAAGFLDHLAGDRIEVLSAGSAPANTLNPAVIEAMNEVGIDLVERGAHPKILDAQVVERCDVVITMGCGDTCPVIAGKRYEDWQLPDPAGQPLEFVRTVRDEIKTLVDVLIETL